LASVDDFLSLDVRVGTIVSAEPLAGARKPALSLRIHFGDLGTRVSTAQISDLYESEELVGLQVVAIVDSEVLVLAADNGHGENAIVIPERPVPDGAKVS
jgi:tRNA-binding protein